MIEILEKYMSHEEAKQCQSGIMEHYICVEIHHWRRLINLSKKLIDNEYSQLSKEMNK